MINSIGFWTFVTALIALAIVCLARIFGKERYCPAPIYVPFLLLAFLALDGGLHTVQAMIDTIWRACGGTGIPRHSAHSRWIYFPLLMVTLVLSAFAIRGLRVVKPRWPLTLGTLTVSAVAIWQGLVSLGWIDPYNAVRLFTPHALDEPWTTIREILPATLVILASVAMLVRGQKMEIAPPAASPSST